MAFSPWSLALAWLLCSLLRPLLTYGLPWWGLDLTLHFFLELGLWRILDHIP